MSILNEKQLRDLSHLYDTFSKEATCKDDVPTSPLLIRDMLETLADMQRRISSLEYGLDESGLE